MSPYVVSDFVVIAALCGWHVGGFARHFHRTAQLVGAAVTHARHEEVYGNVTKIVALWLAWAPPALNLVRPSAAERLPAHRQVRCRSPGAPGRVDH
jgi:hypothetical protein